MHESIAAATYRGFTRQVRYQTETFHARLEALITKTPIRRAPWLRHLRRGLDQIPGLYIVYEERRGEGKRAEIRLVGIDFADAMPPYWSAFMLILSARHQTVQGATIPLKITAHALQRVMQRLHVTDPRVALRLLWPTVHAVMWIGPPDAKATKRLLPVQRVGARHPDGSYQTQILGAAVMVPDQEAPEEWAMVTFVDADKLRPEQEAEVKACALQVSDAAATATGQAA